MTNQREKKIRETCTFLDKREIATILDREAAVAIRELLAEQERLRLLLADMLINESCPCQTKACPRCQVSIDEARQVLEE